MIVLPHGACGGRPHAQKVEDAAVVCVWVLLHVLCDHHEQVGAVGEYLGRVVGEGETQG